MSTVAEDGKTIPKRYTTALDYDASFNPIYLGLANPGSSKAAKQWQIRKLTFDVNANVTDIQYANGSVGFDQIWDNRVALSYS